MIVNWKKERSFSIGLAGGEAKMITLVPGINTVADKDWKGIENHPHVKGFLSDGKLVIVTPPALPEPLGVKPGTEEKAEKPDDLKAAILAMDVQKAVEAVGGIMVKETLIDLIKDEKRDQVKAAIKEQLKAISDFELKKSSGGDKK